MSIILNNDVSKVKKGGRKAKRITMDVFKKELLDFIQKYNPYDKIDITAFMASDDPINDNTDKSSLLGCLCSAIAADATVSKDLSKIEFGRNIGAAHHESKNDNENLFLGLHTTETNLPFLGARFCGDEEWTMVFFILYFDGNKMRGYVPYYTNSYNPVTKAAFGLAHDDEDKVFLATLGKTSDDIQDIESDPKKLIFDIEQRITMI